jgi:hypothetical protein
MRPGGGDAAAIDLGLRQSSVTLAEQTARESYSLEVHRPHQKIAVSFAVSFAVRIEVKIAVSKLSLPWIAKK